MPLFPSMTIPQSMRAVKACSPNRVFVDIEASLPSLRPDYLLIKVASVALNPTDWKGVAFTKQEVPHTIGCDVAGRVVKCGSLVSQNYQPGERVAGLCYGNRTGDPTSGAFGEYALIKGALSLRVPDHVSDAEAATLPVGINIVGQGATLNCSPLIYAAHTSENFTALYQTLQLPPPERDDGEPPAGPAILIYGGATATGMFAVQFARLSGCRVLTTCSTQNFQLMKALGAHEVFDYHDSKGCSAAIRATTNDSLRYSFDCISEGSSLQICADALTTQENVATYVAVLPIKDKFPRKDVQTGWRSGYTAFGEVYHLLGQPQPAKPDDFAFATKFWELVEDLLRQDRFRLGPLVHRREGGLAGIPNGLSELKAGHVAAGKLVFTVEV